MEGLGFPQVRATFLGGPYNKDYSISGSVFGSPCLWKLPKQVPFTALCSMFVFGGDLRPRDPSVLVCVYDFATPRGL